MKIAVKILPRPEVLDSQGRAVQETLTRHGQNLSQCRVGKYIELELEETQKDQALEKARQMAEQVLCNPLIESFELEVL